MHFVRLGTGLGIVVMAALGMGACSSDAVEPIGKDAPKADSGSEPKGELVGRYLVQVDPDAPEPVSIKPVEDDVPSGPRIQRQTDPLPPGSSVMSSVSLVGPGTWHATERVMTATLTLTNNDVDFDLNNPQAVATKLTGAGVSFITTNNGNTGAGAVLAFADVQRTTNPTASLCSPLAPQQTSKYFLQIADPNAIAFSFTLDVRATKTQDTSLIKPDCDQDGFSGESTAVNEAGGDCNDQSAAAQAAFPALPAPQDVCACNASCTTQGALCQLTSTGSNYLCPATTACTCDIDAVNKSDVNITCAQDCASTCDNTTDGTDTDNPARSCLQTCRSANTCTHECINGTSGECRESCQPGSTCDMDCTNTSGTGSCLQACTGNAETGPVTCDLTCDNTSGPDCNQTCTYDLSSCTTHCNGGECSQTCASSSDCTMECDNGSDSCAQSCAGNTGTCTLACTEAPCTQTCTQNAECNMECSDPTGPCTQSCTGTGNQTCNLECTAGSSCTQTCVRQSNGSSVASAPACVLDCNGNPDCTLDCSNYANAAQRAKCQLLNCPAGTTAQQVPANSGIFECL